DVRLALNILALPIWWIGSTIVFFGTQTFRSLFAPLCFLFWLVPLPTVILDTVVRFLQYESAYAARFMLVVVGVPVIQDGLLLSMPRLDIEIARECSSIRSSLFLVIITMVLAVLFLRSMWRKFILILMTIPLAGFKNGLRVFTLVEIDTYI